MNSRTAGPIRLGNGWNVAIIVLNNVEGGVGFRGRAMVLKGILTAVAAAVLLASPVAAAGYRPGDYFSMNLSKTALSPNPLGPPAHFEHVPVEASAPDKVDVPEVKAQRAERTRVRKPHHAVRAKTRYPKLVRRSHGNPMDAQARDTRIQVWPCKSGGICNWRRSR
jgi:hypothetical protein